VRYKLALDAHLREQAYPYRALVAFSGTVKDEGQGRDYTEAGMNGFPERQTAETFKRSEYRFLVVANKFQTGFDQPLLHTMYVDKKLGAVSALQAASPPNSKYAALRTDCLMALRQAMTLLNEPTLHVSPPFPGSVSGIGLLRDGASYVTANPSTVSQVAPMVHQALDTALNNEQGLNNQLQSDAQQMQNDLLAP
jgi:hypothetical protein